mgnify:CR=1 FL=1
MKISVCIPMYNEGDICISCAEKLHGEMAGLFEKYGWDYEIIFCDDGSSDGCREKIERIATEKISVVGYGENRGKGSAVREAVKNTSGDIVVYTDCDLAYGTAVIEKAACELTRCRADMLLGSRNMGNDGYEGYSKRRKIASKIYIKVIAVFAGFRLTDSQCGFKAFKGESARKIFSLCRAFVHLKSPCIFPTKRTISLKSNTIGSTFCFLAFTHCNSCFWFTTSDAHFISFFHKPSPTLQNMPLQR